MTRKNPFYRVTLLLTLLVMATLACNLTAGGGNGGNDADDEVVDTNDGGGQDTTPPTVQIFTPTEGQQVLVDSPVEVRVGAQHPIGVQRIQMKVDDRIVSSKSLLDNPTSVEVLLSWTPDQRGSYTLEVQAFHGATGSDAITVTLQVFPEGSILANPASGQPETVSDTASTCSGRVLISNLNSRSGPATTFSKMGTFSVGETVTVIGRNNASEWYKVRRENSNEVWVNNNDDWLETQGNCSNLPVAE